MTDKELAQHDSKTLLQLLLSADARCDDLTAQLESTLKDRALILAERDRLREALIELIQQTHNCERELTEDLHHVDFCGESVPLTNAREALKGESHD